MWVDVRHVTPCSDLASYSPPTATSFSLCSLCLMLCSVNTSLALPSNCIQFLWHNTEGLGRHEF